MKFLAVRCKDAVMRRVSMRKAYIIAACSRMFCRRRLSAVRQEAACRVVVRANKRGSMLRRRALEPLIEHISMICGLEKRFSARRMRARTSAD